VIGPKLLYADGRLQPSCFRFPSIGRAIKEYWLGQKGLFDKYAPKGDTPQVVDSVVAAVFLITPRALKEVGNIDERYYFYFEDIAYCREVSRKGLKVYYLPEAEIVHLEGASGKSIANPENQWRRLIPSSKIYHGTLRHYILTLIILIGQKWAGLYGHIQKNK
jgi:GT2 family glycosyltransferase